MSWLPAQNDFGETNSEIPALLGAGVTGLYTPISKNAGLVPAKLLNLIFVVFTVVKEIESLVFIAEGEGV